MSVARECAARFSESNPGNANSRLLEARNKVVSRLRFKKFIAARRLLGRFDSMLDYP